MKPAWTGCKAGCYRRAAFLQICLRCVCSPHALACSFVGTHTRVAQVVAVIETMLKEQSMKRIYRFMTLGLFLVVMVLIAALSGITFAIVQMAKDTKASK